MAAEPVRRRRRHIRAVAGMTGTACEVGRELWSVYSRPVIVGTSSVVARAGEYGRITVATNMAGRGTDIRLAPGVVALGGLHVLATVRHDSARIDRQLFGRCGRQGDPGSYQVIVSLEDEIFQSVVKGRALRLRRVFRKVDKALPQWLGALLVRLAQSAAERHHSRIRRELLRSDDQLSDLLAFTGRSE